MESWVIYALIALAAFGGSNLLVKILAGEVPVALLAMLYFTTSFAISAIVFFTTRPSFHFPLKMIPLLIFAGFLFFVGIFMALTALSKGLGVKVVPVYNMNTLVTVLLLVVLLGEKLTSRIGVGIVLAAISLYLLTT